MLDLHSLDVAAARLRRETGQTIAECTVVIATLAISIVVAIAALALTI